jgi:FkbM family methyltransferase
MSGRDLWVSYLRRKALLMQKTDQRHWLIKVRPIELALLLKFLLRIKRRTIKSGDVKMWVDPASNFGSRLLTEGAYEAELSDACRQLLAPGGVFFDVGSNEGWFGMVACKAVGEAGRVFAVEPQERLWSVIMKNAALNGFANFTLLPFGVSSHDGSGVMNLYPSLNSGSSGVASKKRRYERTQDMALLTLAKIIDQCGVDRIDLLKMDIEGLELQALRGAGQHLGSTIRKLIVEVHPALLSARGEDQEEVYKLLGSRGYHLQQIAGTHVWSLGAK